MIDYESLGVGLGLLTGFIIVLFLRKGFNKYMNEEFGTTKQKESIK